MTDAPATVPSPELLAAFEAYERAILANDLEALDAAFARRATTMRADAAGLLVGHEAISDFRGLRGGVPPREIVRLETRVLGPDVVLLVSVSRYRDGGQGVQTQIWEQVDGQWLITAAHVTGRAQAFDRSVWRTVGDPLSQGAWEGPLAGLTVAVKDLFAIRGYRIGAGNPTWLRERRREQATAPAVSDLLRGGASLRGIARTDEFAYSIAGANVHYGTPPNGALPGALPGGSSNGPAAAVALGQADVGLASDTAGSIRVPASYQGLWGLRTTHGIVPRQGMLPLSQTFDTVGWLARDAETLDRVATWVLITDSSADDPEADLTPDAQLPRRIAVPAEALACTEADTRDAFQAWLDRAAATDQVDGVDIVEVGDLSAYLEVFRTVQSAEAWRNNGAWVEAHPGALGPDIAARLEMASRVTTEQERAAQNELSRMRQRIRALTDEAILVLPTAPGPAPARTADGPTIETVRAATLRMTSLAGIGGLPALSAPLLTVPSLLGPAPVGVCFVGPAERDLDLLRWVRAIEAATQDASGN
ncbi:putative amidase [Microlunatus phosphovorus NM-1]|uniref:Putative amidase n=1 Tax=Microlunatus phosphovorus (strain ATCC 700054 / DSM 10555 / JCM 9379 / NBRC 101784 / NCIMB 13414 / VKM Ac-1990 / NM-1) TaxID=1032480 RepID=F5XEK3_MICPN|nr:AtzH-like domain-containing protein [Microlunatus phosphovorus]BAK35219.1 putative amidase [Microlunatus phosphovorus NM-1]